MGSPSPICWCYHRQPTRAAAHSRAQEDTVTCQQHLYIHRAWTTHLGATCWPLPLVSAHRAAQLFGKTSLQSQRWTSRSIHAWLTTEFCLQPELQVQGCCCLHCSQVQQPPRGTRTPQEHSTAPRDNKMTVPAPGAGSCHHHYCNLVRRAASLNRHCLRANAPRSSGLRALNISAGEQQK